VVWLKEAINREVDWQVEFSMTNRAEPKEKIVNIDSNIAERSQNAERNECFGRETKNGVIQQLIASLKV
jgi:hypothetical protein